MVSFQESISSNIQRKTIQEFEINSEKKRRWEDREGDHQDQDLENKQEWKFSKIKKPKSFFDDIKFHHHLEKPSTLDESKQCLDIQSGEVHFYNTKQNQKISYNKDPKQSPKRLEMGPMSLDLELNLLPYDDSPRTQVDENCSTKNDSGNNNNNNNTSVKSSRSTTTYSKDSDRQLMKNSDILTRCPSWMSLEADQQEMVAAACMRCHMLVMLCKSSPACPNCKFMHPPDHQSPVNLFKPRFSTSLSWKNINS
ncbi:hypothetical protein BVC80_9029g28 [Macleaya cordata]|uniref:Uncharacterized protein n=1 Tax=Macleaya cordata TaxID=56857 RepID=A0A200QUQ7_MACCD|nr:hypothetical protein BVC80_9029g28 [Macleaya cordata]